MKKTVLITLIIILAFTAVSCASTLKGKYGDPVNTLANAVKSGDADEYLSVFEDKYISELEEYYTIISDTDLHTSVSEILASTKAYNKDACGAFTSVSVTEVKKETLDEFPADAVYTGTFEPDGEVGELVFTTISRCGTPMLRYRTRDLTRLKAEKCPCGRTMRVMARISARSDDMLIIHGVNVFPGQIEAALLRVPEVAPHYQIVLSSSDTLDVFEIKVEVAEEAFSDNIRHLEDLKRRVLEAVKSIIGLTPRIILVGPGTLPRSEGKIKRVIDNRRK